jgi:hypothetical protein
MYKDDLLYFPASVFLLLYINAMCLDSVQSAQHSLYLMEKLPQNTEHTPDLKKHVISLCTCAQKVPTVSNNGLTALNYASFSLKPSDHGMNGVLTVHFLPVAEEAILNEERTTEEERRWVAALKGLSHEIDLDNVDEN